MVLHSCAWPDLGAYIEGPYILVQIVVAPMEVHEAFGSVIRNPKMLILSIKSVL